MRKDRIVYRCKLSFSAQTLLLKFFEIGASARASARAAGVHRHSATLFFRKLRAAIHSRRGDGRLLAGTVEVDECYLGGAPVEVASVVKRCGDRGKQRGFFKILGGVERVTRRVRLESVSDTRGETLLRFLARYVSVGCTALLTDCFAGYNGARAAGFNHYTVNHSREFYNKKTGACTNCVEGVWSLMRRHFIRFCGGWRHNLRLWLSEMEMRVEFGVERFGGELSKLLLESLSRRRV